MIREELLKIAKPILFNTEMVRAILDERKTVTRRLVRKYDIEAILNSPFHKEHPEVSDIQIINKLCMPPYQQGDILYVRETWCRRYDGEKFFYKADKNTTREEKTLLDYVHVSWKPSIHMPKEAARIFLKVKDVRVERLQDICGRGTPQDHVTNIAREGVQLQAVMENYQKQIDDFKQLWNSTINKSDLALYGWDADPYVWVIEFERIKPDTEV